MFNKTEINFLKHYACNEYEEKFSVLSLEEINEALNENFTFEEMKDKLITLQAKKILDMKYAVNNEFCFKTTRQAQVELQYIEEGINRLKIQESGLNSDKTPVADKEFGKRKKIKIIAYGIICLAIVGVCFLAGMLGGYISGIIG